MANITIHDIKHTEAEVRDLDSFYVFRIGFDTQSEFSNKTQSERVELFFNNKDDLIRFAASINASLSNLLESEYA